MMLMTNAKGSSMTGAILIKKICLPYAIFKKISENLELYKELVLGFIMENASVFLESTEPAKPRALSKLCSDINVSPGHFAILSVLPKLAIQIPAIVYYSKIPEC